MVNILTDSPTMLNKIQSRPYFRSSAILLKNSKTGFSRVRRNLPGDEIVEYGAIVNVEVISPTSRFANKRVFQQNTAIAAIRFFRSKRRDRNGKPPPMTAKSGAIQSIA